MKTNLSSGFGKPGSWFRGHPFWAWNGALEPEELRRQIRLMKRMGLGGFFMHSRVGLATPYLKDEWFRCVEACIDEAGKQGMLAWLYDEDRWPSGAAGGMVTRDPRFRKRSLAIHELSSPALLKWTADLVAAFTARVERVNASGVTRIPRGTKPRSLRTGERILTFRVRLAAASSWYNDATYLDTLNPAAVKKFIAVTHEKYRRRVGGQFSKLVPGIFSDEPNHGHKLWEDPDIGDPPDLPWTAGLAAAFKERYGYDLLPRLVELIYDVDGRGITSARHDYHDCVTALFVDSFSRQIGEWCGDNGLLFTGHVLAEDPLSEQANVVGSAMRFYEHMQAPGIDLLTEHGRAVTAAKQVSSVARQLGKRWRLTETYGCTGWDFPFAGHKALGDLQIALGITLRCQHLAWYTMRGQAKRDYPAAISPQSPWWELYPAVEDYFARVLSVLTRGEEIRDILVIHPIESTWTQIRRGWLDEDPAVRAFDRALIDLEDTLLSAHLDFDYGDEEMLSRLGAVSRRKGVSTIVVGRAAYNVVVVPALLTVRSSTLKLLEKFRTAGGLVVFAGEAAGHVDAEPSQAARSLAALCAGAPASGPGLAAAVESLGRRISITDDAGREISEVLYLLRQDRDSFYLFICNTGLSDDDRKGNPLALKGVMERTRAFPRVKIRLSVAFDGAPRELDPRSGAHFLAQAARNPSGEWEISTSLPALGSRLFVLPRKAAVEAGSPPPVLENARRIPMGDGRWTVTRSEDNVLVLDRPRFRIGAGDWRGPEEILRIDREVRLSLGIAPRGGTMVQPWARKPASQWKQISVELRYRFHANTIPIGRLLLALESPSRWIIDVNGTGVSPDTENGWWVDPSLRTIPIDAALLNPGENILFLSCSYDEEHPGLEIVYLLGDFGVEVEGTDARMIDSPRTLAVGDWTGQGLPFYSGSICYCRSIGVERTAAERVFLHVPEYRGSAVRVLVDGRTAGTIGWEPNEVDITDFLSEGPSDHEIRIEVAGHRRNSHGPLHHALKWPTWTGSEQFVTSGNEWIDGYQLVACGLMQPPVIVIRKPRGQ
jgi:hypothetical protein